MTKEFKTIIAPFLFEGKEYCPQFMQFVDGWPTVEFVDEWHKHTKETRKLSNENVSVISYTNDSITVVAGTEVEGRYLITVIALDNKAVVEFAEKLTHEQHRTLFAQGRIVNEDRLIGLFHDIKIGKRVHQKSRAVWQMELNMALRNQNFEEAAEIRDAMIKAGIK